MSHSQSPPIRFCRGCGTGSPTRSRRPIRTAIDAARHLRCRADLEGQRGPAARLLDASRSRSTCSSTGRATSSASSRAPSSRPSRATGSRTSNRTTCRTSISTTRIFRGATRRRAPTAARTAAALDHAGGARGRRVQGRQEHQGQATAVHRGRRRRGEISAADQLWAWAHVHVNATWPRATPRSLDQHGAPCCRSSTPRSRATRTCAYSRLLCPRKLKPNTAYHAFVIPTFETGRSRGLGLAVEADFATPVCVGHARTRPSFRTTTAGTSAPASGRLRIPGAAAQGEARGPARRAAATWTCSSRMEPAGIDPDGTLGGILRLGGALRVPEDRHRGHGGLSQVRNWDRRRLSAADPERHREFPQSRGRLQKPGANPQPIPDPDDPPDPDPLITPPLYGRWHARRQRLLTRADGTPPAERSQLDPRAQSRSALRVPRGFGTSVIQKIRKNT